MREQKRSSAAGKALLLHRIRNHVLMGGHMKLEEILMSQEGAELQLVIESKETGEKREFRHSGYYCRRDDSHNCLIIGEGCSLNNSCRLGLKELSIRRMRRILNYLWDIDAENEGERYGILISGLLFL